MKKMFVVLMAVVGLAWIGCDSGDGGSGGDTGNGGNPPAGDMCGGLCQTGQYCWNGVCVNGCTSDANCDANKYCAIDEITKDGSCQPKQVSGCTSDADCAETQECKVGACVTPSVENEGACEWKPDMTDGCSEYEVCVESENGTTTQCYAMPACGQDGSCPKDVAGGVCNIGADGKAIIPSKTSICLMGLCKADTDCPSEWACTKVAGDIGACMMGGVMPGGCSTDDDCEEGEKCMGAMGDIKGVCAPDMGM